MRRRRTPERTGFRAMLAAGVWGLFACTLLAAPSSLFAQSGTSAQPAGAASSGGAAKGGTPAASGGTLQPVFPAQNQDLIFVEGEDAVVTNFDKQPILNYSASGLRTLQLSSTADPAGNAGYYADYVFYVDQPGTYEFWYGGTPPGPKSTAQPSYTSPFSYSIDGGDPVKVYAENVSVTGSYTPLYYWNRVGTVQLTKGPHQLRFQVTDKRRYDNRYFFYLDCFFLVREAGGTAVPGTPLPEVFPKSLQAGRSGEPYKSIEDYLIDIRDHPSDIQAYIDLSLDYSMVGDNLNALKYLNRAGELDPKNEAVSLLKAKNMLWKGDTSSGLTAYRDLLNRDPNNVGLWAEAGKVAAWTGRYADSVSFFEDGLKHFPGNLNLLVNLGLTYLWSGNEPKAQQLFAQAHEAAAKDYGRLMVLAQTLNVAQAYTRAAAAYQAAIKDYPKNLEAYLALEKLYLDTGKSAEADKVRQEISSTFVQSAQLKRFLGISETKQRLKSQVITGYEQKLANQPDDLGLREILARAYFWNGMQEKGTAEYLSILVNYTYRKLLETDKGSEALLRLLDRGYVFARYFQDAPATAQQLQNNLSDSLTAYQAAAKELKDYRAKVDAARKQGQAAPKPSGEDPQTKVQRAEQAVATSIAKAQGFLDDFSHASAGLKPDESALQKLEQKEKSDQSAFEKLIASSKWHWNEDDTLAELEQAKSAAAALADFSLAKIDQIEGRLSSAAAIYRSNVDQPNPRFRYGLSQTLLWMGSPDQAAVEIKKLPAGAASVLPPEDWSQLATTLNAGSDAAGFAAGAPDERLVKDILSRLATVSDQAKREVASLNQNLTLMHTILRDRLVRGLYQNQEDTFQLRKDLGDYYLNEKRYDAAIRQFRQVLAIDPWNVGALYRIGQVYEQQGNWSQALANYEKVYYSDPTYENVAHQYNVLARRHPDTLAFNVQSTSDTQHVQFLGTADYTTLLDSIFGLDLHYAANSQRLYHTGSPEAPSTYLTNTVTVGMPINLYWMNLTITPQAGGTIINHLDTNSTAAGLPSPPSPLNYLNSLSVDPFLEVNGQMNIGKYLYANATYSYTRQSDTYVPDRLSYDIFDNSALLNLSANLGFLGVAPLKNSSLQASGQMDFLTDSNILTSLYGELDLGVLNLSSPQTTLALVGNAQLNTSKQNASPDYLYYAPKQEVLAGGGLQGSTWLPVGNDTIGLSLRAIASSYTQLLFGSAPVNKMLQLSGDVRVEYDRGGAAIYLDTAASATYQYNPAIAAPQSPWNYWSFTINLGYSTQLPKLLAP